MTRSGAVVRPYAPADAPALRDVCIRTGHAGGDATGLFHRPDLLHRIYLDPYLEHAPDLAFVADDGAPAGYVVGVADTAAFEAWCDEHWWPALRGPLPDGEADDDPGAWLLRLPHDPPRTAPHVLDGHPAHLHVDLLPRLQGGGHGRHLLGTLFGALRRRGVPGVHLGVSTQNPRAVGFYRHLGFRTLTDAGGSLVLGLDLT